MRIDSFWKWCVCLSVLGVLAACGKEMTDAEHVRNAQDFFDKRDWRATGIELKNALQKNPNSAEARWLLGQVYVEIGSGVAAEKELRRAGELGVVADALAPWLAHAYLLQGKYDEIVKEFSPDKVADPKIRVRLLGFTGEALLGLRRIEAGCGRFAEALALDASYVPAYWGSAKCLAIEKKADEARQAVEKAIQLDAGNYRSWILLGDFHVIEKRPVEAENSFSKAIGINGQSIEAMDKRAEVRIGAGKIAEGLEDTVAVLKLAKNDVIALQLQGVAFYRQKKFTDAKSRFENVLKISPDYLPAALWLGITSISLGQFEQANSYIGQFVSRVPTASDVRALQAFVQSRLGNRKGAATTLAQLQGVNFENSETLALMGQAHLSIGETERAIGYFKAQLQKDPESVQPHYGIAVALLQKGEEQKAVDELQRVLELDPANTDAQVLLIRTLLAEGQIDAALKQIGHLKLRSPKDPLGFAFEGVAFLLRKDENMAVVAFESALNLKRRYPPAAYYLAQIALKRGDKTRAKSYYESVLVDRPAHPGALVALIEIEAGAGNHQVVRALLQRAQDADPKASVPATLMARELINTGEASKAINVTRRAIEAFPNDSGLIEVRGLAYLEVHDGVSALDEFKRLVRIRPNSASAHFYLARAYAENGDVNGLSRELSEALRLQPKHYGAKAAQAELRLKQGRLDESMMMAREIAREFPEIPEGALLQARVLVAQKKVGEAARILETVGAQFPACEGCVVALGQVLWVQNRRSEAIERVRNWRGKHKGGINSLAFMGDAYAKTGRDSELVALFEGAVQERPTNPLLLNNLAWALRKIDPVRALSTAARAFELAPKSSEIADTYGWLLLAQGDKGKALEVLRQAAESPTKNATFRFHYARALVVNAQIEKAKTILAALVGDEPFPEQSEAEALLRTISSNR